MDEYAIEPKTPGKAESDEKSKKPKNRRYRVLLLVLAIVFLSIGAAYLWTAQTYGWMSEDPKDVVRRAFVMANKGKFDEVGELLLEKEKEFFDTNPKLFLAIWNRLTRNQRVIGVKVETTRGSKLQDLFNKSQLMTCDIRYINDDEQTVSFLVWLNNQSEWRISMVGMMDGIDPELDIRVPQYAIDSLAIRESGLMEKYTRIPDTDLYLRLPWGTLWNKERREFYNPNFFFTVRGKKAHFMASDRFQEQTKSDLISDNYKILEEKSMKVDIAMLRLLSAEERDRTPGRYHLSGHIGFGVSTTRVSIDVYNTKIGRILANDVLRTTQYGTRGLPKDKIIQSTK